MTTWIGGETLTGHDLQNRQVLDRLLVQKSKTPLFSISYMYLRRLDTPHLDEYGARDFEGILNISARRANGAGAMANPRDTKRPESGSDGTLPTGDLAARIARAQA